jgi:hypothetical protein
MFNSFLLNRTSTFPYNHFALFAGGYTPPGSPVPPGWTPTGNGFFTNTTEKYIFDSNVVNPGTNLGEYRENLHSAGNYVIGIITGGDAPNQDGSGNFTSGSYNTHYTDKYTYLTDTVNPGTLLGTGRNEHAGCGTAFVGIFAGGANDDHAVVATSEKYTYANDAITAGGNLTVARRWIAASSNPYTGIYVGGFVNSGLKNVDLYTFASDTVAAGTNLTEQFGQFGRTGSGNSTTALIGGGYKNGSVTAAVDKYTYTTATWTAGTNLTFARHQFAAASSPNIGVFGSGSATSSDIPTDWSRTDIYVHATDAVSQGTHLIQARYCISGLSTSPSGL